MSISAEPTPRRPRRFDEPISIASRRVRRVILVHSGTSLFYNAFLIAIAIQVIQGLIGGD